MLQKVVAKEGKDWNKLLQHLLFTYREVHQALTGFSPFKLLYGRAVQGPLDVIRETYKADVSGSSCIRCSFNSCE